MLRCTIAFCFIWLCPEYALAETWQIDKETSEVSFVAIGSPGFIRIEGEGGKISGKIVDGKGELSVYLKDLDTGMDLRNRHMKDKYLKVDKYPNAILVVHQLKEVKPDGYYIAGVLKIKENSKKITVMGKVVEVGKDYKIIEAGISINIKDYPSIGIPQFLGITVANKIEVDVKFKGMRLK